MSALNRGISRYLTGEQLGKIGETRVGIAGLGGLGSNCAQALVRLGFKNFILADFDVVDASNLNRQFYFEDQLEMNKTAALKENLHRISGDLNLCFFDEKLTKENMAQLFYDCDVVVEAFDSIPAKKMFLESMGDGKRKIISASGLGKMGWTDGIVTRELSHHWTQVGDGVNCITRGVSPLAPGVLVAAAKQAGAVLDHVLQQGSSNFRLPDLYGLTYSACSAGRSTVEVVKEMIRGDIKLIQYREKDKSLQEKYRECREIRRLTAQAGVTFIINDHLDIAQMVDADGVHIGQDDIPLPQVRSLMGRKKIIGLSTHSPEQARQAMALGADYIGVGPIYATNTKVDVCPAVGHSYLEWAVENVNIPFVAIGGIKKHNLHEIIGRGAKSVALVSEITGHPRIPQLVDELRQMMRNR